jgi:hypothetical protein
VAREDVLDEPAPSPAQRDRHEPAIVDAAHLVYEAAPHQIGDDHGGVAVAAQQLRPEVPLAQRPVVQQRFQHAELADRQAGRAHHVTDAGGDRLRGPHQLDVRVEGRRLRRGALITRGHSSNLKGF